MQCVCGHLQDEHSVPDSVTTCSIFGCPCTKFVAMDTIPEYNRKRFCIVCQKSHGDKSIYQCENFPHHKFCRSQVKFVQDKEDVITSIECPYCSGKLQCI